MLMKCQNTMYEIMDKKYKSNCYFVDKWSDRVDDQRSKQEDDRHDPCSQHGTHLLNLRWVANSYERFHGYTDNVPVNSDKMTEYTFLNISMLLT